MSIKDARGTKNYIQGLNVILCFEMQCDCEMHCLVALFRDVYQMPLGHRKHTSEMSLESVKILFVFSENNFSYLKRANTVV